MAFESTSRPDFSPDFNPEKADKASPRGPEWTSEGSSDAVGRLASAFPSLGGTSSVDLALDLLLNQIVEQARLATTATGAAIALLRDGEMVCRATAGWNAPDLGMRMSRHSGLSGKCIQTLQLQLCKDTESDERVDAESCRRLNIRSILAYPLLEEGKLEGVFEIFSSLPDAFGERDIQTLEALRWRIFQTLRRAADTAESPAATVPEPEAENAVSKDATAAAAEPGLADPLLQQRPSARDPWTTALSGAILVLTFLLVGLLIANWQRGRAAERRLAERTGQRTQVRHSTEPGASPAAADPPAKTPVTPNAAKNRAAQKPAASASSSGAPEGAGGLVVYEQGRVVFREPPVVNASRTLAEPVANEDSAPVDISTDEATQYLLKRVEPQYPAEAREQHIEGTVLLQVVVSKDGGVRQIVMLGGNETLAAAATEAVRQWRFRPYLRAGKPVEVQTQVTINFRLP